MVTDEVVEKAMKERGQKYNTEDFKRRLIASFAVIGLIHIGFGKSQKQSFLQCVNLAISNYGIKEDLAKLLSIEINSMTKSKSRKELLRTAWEETYEIFSRRLQKEKKNSVRPI